MTRTGDREIGAVSGRVGMYEIVLTLLGNRCTLNFPNNVKRLLI